MKKIRNTNGFTIVELLTVMSVIAILMGLLVPALQQVRRVALETKQRAQFHAIDVALNIFNSDEETFPQSASINVNGMVVTGAHRLAEALVGRDLQGYDPMLSWDTYPGWTDTLNSPESRKRRKGPYLNLENVGAFDVRDLYGNGISAYTGGPYSVALGANYPSPVLTDAFRKKKVKLYDPNNSNVVKATIKAGTPILYFKANESGTMFDPQNPPSNDNDAVTNNWVYNYYDNEVFFNLGTIKDPNVPNQHPFADPQKFYEAIWNPQVTTTDRPYNSKTYILLSAGYDMKFGTSDDIWNFSSGE